MIKITKFEVSNYRSCLKSTIDLEKNLMCLIGVNGVGKTSILNGIQLLKKIKGRNRFTADNAQNSSGSITRISASFIHDEKEIKLKCDIRYDTDDRNNDEVLDATLKFNLFEFTGNKKWVEIPADLFQYLEVNYASSHNSSIRQYFRIIKGPSEKEGQILSLVRRFTKRISYYSASQFSDPTKCPISFELDDSKPGRLSRFNIVHEKFLNDIYLTYKNNKRLFQKFLSTVNKEGIGIIDDISFAEYDMPSSSYEVKSGGKIKKIERNRQLIIPSVTIDKIQLSPNQLSEGTFKTLALVFYIITDDNDLLMIEEPEVCVHHGLLNSIISLIISHSNKKQIIISTHSDFVLDRLTPDNLLIVKKENSKGTIVKPLTKALSKNDFKVLKEYLSETGNLGEYWKEGGFDNE